MCYLASKVPIQLYDYDIAQKIQSPFWNSRQTLNCEASQNRKPSYILQVYNDICWVSNPGQGIFYIPKQTWPPGSPSIPRFPTWHTLPPNLNFPAQGLGCPSPAEVTQIFAWSPLPLPPPPPSHIFFSRCAPCSTSLWRVPWFQSLGPVTPLKSSFQINLSLI